MVLMTIDNVSICNRLPQLVLLHLDKQSYRVFEDLIRYWPKLINTVRLTDQLVYFFSVQNPLFTCPHQSQSLTAKLKICQTPNSKVVCLRGLCGTANTEAAQGKPQSTRSPECSRLWSSLYGGIHIWSRACGVRRQYVLFLSTSVESLLSVFGK